MVKSETIIKEVSTRRGGIGQSIYELFDKKGIENVTYEECETLAKKIKPDTKFNPRHFSFYKNEYIKKSNIPYHAKLSRGKEFGEEFHTKGKPQQIIELFRSIDRFCFSLDPSNIQRNCHKKYIKYSHGRNIFCSMHLWNTIMRIWLKLSYDYLTNPPEYVRDVTNIGHWGVGDVEVAIDSLTTFQSVTSLIKKSFETNRSK